MAGVRSGNSFKDILWLQWIAAAGAMIMLFALGLMIGWTSPYLAQLTAKDSSLPISMIEASWVASLFNLGRFFGAILGGISIQYFGSKHTLVFIGLPLMTGWICIIAANSVIWLYIARVVSGLSLGMSFTSFPIFLGEISSPRIRGALVSLAITGINFGNLIGNIMGPHMSMMLFSVISLVPNVVFILLFLWVPQSPHYLVRLGRIKDAEKAIARYDPNANSELEVQSLKQFIAKSETLSLQDRLREFIIPQNRKAVILVIMLFFFSQFSGLNTVIFYMEIILTKSKFTAIRPATGVIVISAIGVVSGWVSILIADKFRRKILMIVSSAGVGVSMIALDAHFAILENDFDPNALQWLPITSLIFFEIFIVNGIIAVPSMMLSELFAPNIKNFAACIASVSVGLFAFAAAKIYQPSVDLIGEAYVFWIHTLLMAMCVIFSAIFLPETKGKSLQEIQDLLSRSKLQK